MFLAGLTAELFATNCYILAVDRNHPCLVVDPGAGVVDRLASMLRQHQLQPAAVLLTHGHFDHTYSAADVSNKWRIPVYISEPDRGQLLDPTSGLSPDLRDMIGEDFTITAPSMIRTYSEGAPEAATAGEQQVSGVRLAVAGLELTVDPAPGHTPGSVLIRVQADDRQVCLAGDVLFAGSVGRTDLVGGDPAAMRASLRDRIATLPPDTVVLSGHGPQTTIGRELASNPYLRAALAGAGC